MKDLRTLRLENGWSQEQLAEFTGISVRTIQRLEKGQKPGLETAKALAAVFETEVTAFLPIEPLDEPEDLPMHQEDHSDTDHHRPPRIPRETRRKIRQEEAAMRYVGKLKGFYSHATIYGVFAVAMIVLNLMASPGRFWAVWPIMGWGIAVAMHAMSVFNFSPFGRDWERRAYERKLAEIKSRTGEG